MTEQPNGATEFIGFWGIDSEALRISSAYKHYKRLSPYSKNGASFDIEVTTMAPKMNFSTTPLSKVPSPQFSDDEQPGRPVVLVVDDEEIVADTLALILNQYGFATMTAYDAQTALEIAAVIPPELLVCELSMPHMNGFDVAEKITSTAPDCNVVLLSGRATSVSMAGSTARKNYEFVFLNKPFHPSVLLSEIAEPLKKRSLEFRTHLMVGQEIA